ncbi:MAG: hypothetical protein CL489_06640 [Acidobacteria bacterium]|nr:hypothetical protein [Acidobacteriota bacterium]
MSDDTHPNAHFDGPDDDIHGKIKHYMGKAYLAVESMHKDMTAWFHTISDQLANTQNAIITLNQNIITLNEIILGVDADDIDIMMRESEEE